MSSAAHALLLFALAAWPSAMPAQSPLAERLSAAGTRTVAFTTAARPEVCGDGKTFLSDGLGDEHARFYEGFSVGADWQSVPCVRGPVRIVVRVVDGLPSRLRTFAGPLTALGDTILDLGAVRVADAAAYLRELSRSGDGRVAEQALLPIVLIDSVPRWEILAAAARDSTRLLRYRRRASDLLARGATHTLGAAAFADDAAAGERRAAVNALARRRARDDDPVPDLIAIARANKHADARAAAMLQLGQTADPRGVDILAAVLGVK